MKYAAELRFMRKTFTSCKLQSLILDTTKSFDLRMDLRMHSLIGWIGDYEQTLTSAMRMARPYTLYHISDQFHYNTAQYELHRKNLEISALSALST